MRASDNNRGTTVLHMFHDATAQFGMPSRMRGDCGGENLELAVWMIVRNGANRASFMWGS